MSTKKILLILSAGLFLTFLIAGSLLFVIASAVLAGVALYLHFNGKEKSSSSDSKSDTEVKASAIDPIEVLLQQNLHLRKARITQNVLQRYEELIDQLIRVWPRIQQDSPEGELTWVVNRMATEYLPQKSITPYLNLPKSEQEQSSQSVIEALEGMGQELSEIEQMLDNQATSEFDRKAKFLKQRFL